MATLSDDTPSPLQAPAGSYAEEASLADAVIDEKLMLIRRASDAGDLTAAESAEARVRAMQDHLVVIRRLREKHFGPGDGGWNSGTCST